MTIRSDRWIRQQCVTPEYELINHGRRIRYLSPPYNTIEQHLIDYYEFQRLSDDMEVTVDDKTYQLPSTISVQRSDAPHVVKAAENFTPMIVPFVDHQVRRIEPQGVVMIKGEVSSVDALPEDAVENDTYIVGKDFYHRHNDQWRVVEFGEPDPAAGTGGRIISYGLSSFGYDVRLADEFRIFTNINGGVIDPMNMNEDCFTDVKGAVCVIPPNSYALGRTVEYFNIPRDVSVLCVGKSTYARAGVIINVTPIEAGFEGEVVIEISNATPLPVKVYAGMGIAQFQFFQSEENCEISYADRGGKYQGQRGITLARL